jgi:hypothetical protein
MSTFSQVIVSLPLNAERGKCTGVLGYPTVAIMPPLLRLILAPELPRGSRLGVCREGFAGPCNFSVLVLAMIDLSNE